MWAYNGYHDLGALAKKYFHLKNIRRQSSPGMHCWVVCTCWRNVVYFPLWRLHSSLLSTHVASDVVAVFRRVPRGRVAHGKPCHLSLGSAPRGGLTGAAILSIGA